MFNTNSKYSGICDPWSLCSALFETVDSHMIQRGQYPVAYKRTLSASKLLKKHT